MSSSGSPSSAAASPSRCRIPSEYVPTRRLAAACSSTRRSTSSTRKRGRSTAAASMRDDPGRIGRDGSRSPRAPHRRGGSAVRVPRTAGRRRTLGRSSAAASPSTIRSVVVLPAPFGPRKPMIVPARARRRDRRLRQRRRTASSGTRRGRPASSPRPATRLEKLTASLVQARAEPRSTSGSRMSAFTALGDKAGAHLAFRLTRIGMRVPVAELRISHWLVRELYGGRCMRSRIIATNGRTIAEVGP
jgi:hypothetical protein